jgi:hypothetical protein
MILDLADLIAAYLISSGIMLPIIFLAWLHSDFKREKDKKVSGEVVDALAVQIREAKADKAHWKARFEIKAFGRVQDESDKILEAEILEKL